MSTLIDEALAARARGWPLTPLSGKRPVLGEWTTRLPPTEADIRRWIERGRNLGMRTGISVFVLDSETDEDLDLPRTPTVRTGSGGRHYYFRAPGSPGSRHPGPCPGNTTKLLGPHIDTRGVGGQVVYPGSIHPETGEPYTWYITPEEAELADIPDEILARLRPRESKPYVPTDPGPGADAWGATALEREVAEVAAAIAGEGRAHGQMCRSAFKLGQIAGAGLLALNAVVDRLVAAALIAGWEEREARRVASECAEAGRGNPRGPMPSGLEDLVVVPDDGPPPATEPRQSDHPPLPEMIRKEAEKLLEDAVARNDPTILFERAALIAQLQPGEAAAFVHRAKEQLPGLSKTDLKGAIGAERRAQRESSKTKKRAEAQRLRRKRRSAAIASIAKESVGRRQIELFDAGLARDPKLIHDEAVQALVDGNTPERVFIRGGSASRVGEDEEHRPSIAALGEKELERELLRSALFIGKNWEGLPQPANPPASTIRTLLGTSDLPFPPLLGVTGCPVLREDGTILSRPGYDLETRLVYAPAQGLVVPEVPADPTRLDLERARAVLEKPFSQFPFVDAASHANALGLLLTGFVQPYVQDHRPLCVIDSRQPGSGKGLIAAASSLVLTGRPPTSTRFRRDEEFEKKLGEVLSRGAPFILIDNMKAPLESSTLESILTSRRHSDRILGHNDRGFDVPQDAVWCAAGNNVEVGTEMTRRSYLIDLDPKHPHPEDREGPRPGEAFLDIERWVSQHRGELIAAALTLIRAWWVAGRPGPDLKPWGSFQRWQETVGGVLAFAGVEGFLGNRQRFRATHDEERRQWEAFLRLVGSSFEGPFTTRNLCDALERSAQLRDVLPEWIGRHQREDFIQPLGIALKGVSGRRLAVDGLRLERLDDEGHGKVARWRVVTDG